MNSNFFSAYLSKLIIIKKMIIARVNLHIQIKYIRKLQYQYSDHIVCFMQNTQLIINSLFRISKSLNIFLIRSQFDINNIYITIYFNDEFRVRYDIIHIWFVFFQKNHFTYYFITLNHKILNILSKNNNVTNNLLSQYKNKKLSLKVWNIMQFLFDNFILKNFQIFTNFTISNLSANINE